MGFRSFIRARFRLGLGHRVVGLALLAVVVAGVPTSWLVIHNSRGAIRDGILERNLTTATLAGELAAEIIRGAEGSLRQLSEGPVFLKAVRDHDLATAELRLQQSAATFVTFDSISVYSAAGIGWASSLGSAWQNRGGSVTDREWFQVASSTKAPHLGLPILSRATGHATVPYALPIFDANGELIATLVGGISLAEMSDTIVEVDLDESTRASLIDTRQGGFIVADANPDLLLQPVSAQDQTLTPALAGQRGTVQAPDASGEMQLVAFAPLAGVPWSVVIRESTSAAFAPVRAATARAAIIVVAFLLAALVASTLLARRITVPLRGLVRGAEEVGKGDLDYRLNVVGKDEIGVVARAFDRMTAELQATLVSRDQLAAEVMERWRAEEALEALTGRQHAILAAVPDILMEVDDDKVYTWANPAGLEFFGEDAVGKEAADFFEGEQDTYETVAPLFDGSEDLLYVESWQRRRDGERRLLAWVCRSLRDETGRATGALSSALDITDRRRAEENLRKSEAQLRQSQKMEAVGLLAGGMAHDFNNLLTAIIGYSDLILAGDRGEQGALLRDLSQIRQAAERASALTRQMLAFSRRQALNPLVVCLNDMVRGMEPLLRRTLGEDIDLVTRVDPALALSEVDVNQFEQVLLNLAVNARDSMPAGGKLMLETDNVELDEEYCITHPDARPGVYVALSVTDTGCGMDPEVASHIFEPFFTTKPPGQGTGLGLSTVYGIVSQSGGSVSVYSEPGVGTTFKVYLPIASRPATSAEPSPATAALPRGKETILVVEDEEALALLVARILEDLGYHVLLAATAAEAELIMDEDGDAVDLLLTDVVLPGTAQGNDLARHILETRPDLPVLYMSGYTREAITKAGRLDEGVNYLPKPFTRESLAAAVREVLVRNAR